MNQPAPFEQLNREIARASQVTESALRAFAQAVTVKTEAIAGTFGAFLGLGGANVLGHIYPAFASPVLEVSAFGGVGALFVLAARLLGPARRREREDERRSELAFHREEVLLKLETLSHLPAWVAEDTRDKFAQDLLHHMRSSMPRITQRQHRPELPDYSRDEDAGRCDTPPL